MAARRPRAPVDWSRRSTSASEGNPFFAEELLAAAVRGEETLPAGLKDALLHRVARLDPDSRTVLRIAAAAGRDIPTRSSPLYVAPREAPPGVTRAAVEQGVMVPDQPSRHSGSGTPCSRRRCTRRSCQASARRCTGSSRVRSANAPRSLPDGRPRASDRSIGPRRDAREALAASVQAASDAEAVSGLAEALRHLERALELWEQVPSAEELAGLELSDVLARAAELADLTGNGRRAAVLTQQASSCWTNAVLRGAWGCCTSGLAATCSHWVPARRDSTASSGRSTWSRRSRPQPSASGCSRLWATRSCSPGVTPSPAQYASRRWRSSDAIGDVRPALRAETSWASICATWAEPEEGCGCSTRQPTGEDTRHAAGPRAQLRHALRGTRRHGQLQTAAETALEGLGIARRTGLERSSGRCSRPTRAEAFLESGDWSRADEVLGDALLPLRPTEPLSEPVAGPARDRPG